MRFQIFRRAGAVAVACVAALVCAPPTTTWAANSKYPPASAARGFSGGAAGWDSSSSTDGNCLPPLVCANVENSFQGSGGADGGGYIRSAYTGVVGVTAVGGTTTAVWQSPPFAYSGAAGGTPAGVNFQMDRRADVDQLLGVAGNAAEYSARLVDLSAGGEAMTLIAPTTLAGAGSWTSVAGGPVNPRSLTIGDEYRIQISSRYSSGTSALVSGSADYDDVVLTAVDGGRGGSGDNGDKGAGGSGKGGGAFDSQRLEELLRQATPETATLNGKRLLVRVTCPRKVGRQCRTTVQGLLKKSRPATNRRTVRLRRGKSKLVALKVKPKARERVAMRKRILVRQKVRAGRVTATVFKRRLLIRR